MELSHDDRNQDAADLGDRGNKALKAGILVNNASWIFGTRFD
jgi:hypothetical protein